MRVSDSGLGCGPAGSGFHGWPFCNGDVVPGIDLNSIVEYTHRALAGVVEHHDRLDRRARLAPLPRVPRARPSRSLALILAQAALGGATVEDNLEEALRRRPPRPGDAAARRGCSTLYRNVSGATLTDGGPGMRVLAVAASVGGLCTIVAGGYMAGTQNYGRADYQLGDGAHHACGKEFPTCNGEFMPFGKARLVDIHLTHRAFMYLAVMLVTSLVVVALRRGGADPLRLGPAGAAGRCRCWSARSTSGSTSTSC